MFEPLNGRSVDCFCRFRVLNSFSRSTSLFCRQRLDNPLKCFVQTITSNSGGRKHFYKNEIISCFATCTCMLYTTCRQQAPPSIDRCVTCMQTDIWFVNFLLRTGCKYVHVHTTYTYMYTYVYTGYVLTIVYSDRLMSFYSEHCL